MKTNLDKQSLTNVDLEAVTGGSFFKDWFGPAPANPQGLFKGGDWFGSNQAPNDAGIPAAAPSDFSGGGYGDGDGAIAGGSGDGAGLADGSGGYASAPGADFEGEDVP